MDKRGLSKIFWIVMIIILIIAIFIIVTTSQSVSFAKTMQEGEEFQEDFQDLIYGDCGEYDDVVEYVNELKSDMDKMCGNFLLRKIIDNQEGSSFSCDAYPALEDQIDDIIVKLGEACLDDIITIEERVRLQASLDEIEESM